MGWAARKNPRSLEGKRGPRAREAVDAARIRQLVSQCSGPEELAAYVRRTFAPEHRRGVFKLMLDLAPDEWRANARRPLRERLETIELSQVQDPNSFDPINGVPDRG